MVRSCVHYGVSHLGCLHVHSFILHDLTRLCLRSFCTLCLYMCIHAFMFWFPSACLIGIAGSLKFGGLQAAPDSLHYVVCTPPYLPSCTPETCLALTLHLFVSMLHDCSHLIRGARAYLTIDVASTPFRVCLTMVGVLH